MKKLPPKANIERKNLVFAERFASLRKSRGVTQRAIAEKLGITDRAVSKWEIGRDKLNYIFYFCRRKL